MAENALILQDLQQPALTIVAGDEVTDETRLSEKPPYGISFMPGREIASVFAEAVWQRRSEVVGDDPRFYRCFRIMERIPGIGIAYYYSSSGGVYRYLLPE